MLLMVSTCYKWMCNKTMEGALAMDQNSALNEGSCQTC